MNAKNPKAFIKKQIDQNYFSKKLKTKSVFEYRS